MLERLSPRQRECLRLVWERQATSKEIAAELGISKTTVDGYIAEAVEILGARDRRDAAAIACGAVPRAGSGADPARVAEGPPTPEQSPASMETQALVRPWRSEAQPRNALTLAQTMLLIAAVAIGSLLALALAVSVGNGIAPIAVPLVRAVHRLIS